MFAPDAAKGADGQYYLFYGLDFAGVAGAMSVVVCDTPAGKYEYYGAVHYPDGRVLGIKDGEPPEWAEAVDWGAIDKSANTPVAGAMAYTLTWDSLRPPGMTITASFSSKNAAKPASPSG
jgi:hypothetical protein